MGEELQLGQRAEVAHQHGVAELDLLWLQVREVDG